MTIRFSNMNVSGLCNLCKNTFGEVVREKTYLEGVQELMRKEREDGKYRITFPRFFFSVRDNREMWCHRYIEK